jgi:hypothetical protein
MPIRESAAGVKLSETWYKLCREEWRLALVDPGQHVFARSDGAFGCVPQDSRRQARDAIPKSVQDILEEQIRFKTVSAATPAHHFLFE